VGTPFRALRRAGDDLPGGTISTACPRNLMTRTPPAAVVPRHPARARVVRRVLAVTAGTLVAGAWYAFRPDRLFTTRVVDEPAPAAVVAPTAERTGTPPSAAPSAAASAAPSASDGVFASDTGTVGAVSALATGRFHSNAHPTRGTATVLEVGPGRRVLRLTGFATSNGPDVRVVLVAAPDVPDDATVRRAGYVQLGKLKGTRGDQNYDIPASLDLTRHRTVTIWCERFRVNFGSAPLTAGPLSAAPAAAEPITAAQ
jgi:hypothetical protein